MLMTAAGRSTVYGLFRAQAMHRGATAALVHDARTWSYAELLDDVDRLAATFCALGVARGDRIAVLSENRPEYVLTQLAAAKVGAIVACQNVRLADPELAFCLAHVTPKLTLVSPAYAATMARLDVATEVVPLAGLQERAAAPASFADVDPEDPLLLLYTSGTTGRPKGALISHRAEIARMAVSRMDFGIGRGAAHVA